jgi:hypothetical protein
MQAFCRALFRTRTGDPLLTIEVAGGPGIPGNRLPASYSLHYAVFPVALTPSFRRPCGPRKPPYLSPLPVPMLRRRDPPCIVRSGNDWTRSRTSGASFHTRLGKHQRTRSTVTDLLDRDSLAQA